MWKTHQQWRWPFLPSKSVLDYGWKLWKQKKEEQRRMKQEIMSKGSKGLSKGSKSKCFKGGLVKDQSWKCTGKGRGHGKSGKGAGKAHEDHSIIGSEPFIGSGPSLRRELVGMNLHQITREFVTEQQRLRANRSKRPQRRYRDRHHCHGGSYEDGGSFDDASEDEALPSVPSSPEWEPDALSIGD